MADLKDLGSLAKIGGVVQQSSTPSINSNVAFLKEIRETVGGVLDLYKMFVQTRNQGQGVKAMTQIEHTGQPLSQSGDVNPPKSGGGGIFPFIMAIVEREIKEGRGNKPITPNGLVELVKKSMGG